MCISLFCMHHPLIYNGGARVCDNLMLIFVHYMNSKMMNGVSIWDIVTYDEWCEYLGHCYL